MSPWEAIIEKVPEGCRTLLAAAARPLNRDKVRYLRQLRPLP